MAMGATVLDWRTIGRGAVVGAGGLVTRYVAEGVLVIGQPARVVEESFGGLMTALPPLVINAALTGMVPRKKDNPHVPETPAEIAEDVERCVAAGASIVHLHARDERGNPDLPPRRVCRDRGCGQEQVHRSDRLCLDTAVAPSSLSKSARRCLGSKATCARTWRR